MPLPFGFCFLISQIYEQRQAMRRHVSFPSLRLNGFPSPPQDGCPKLRNRFANRGPRSFLTGREGSIRILRMERRSLPRRLVTANPAMREKTEASACPPTCPSKLERSWKPGEGWKRRLVQPGVWGLFGMCRAGGRRSNRAAFISLRRDKPARQARDECGIGVME
jgi:hypothetical protein